MSEYIKPLLRMFILFALVFTVGVLAKPTPASAYTDCCTNCQNKFAACIAACGNTPGCRLSCGRQESLCIEVCPACVAD